MVLLSHINWSEQFKLQWRESVLLCALLVSKINSGVPCPQLNVSEHLLRDVKAAASKWINDLRAAREEAAANNDVAVESEDESDDE